MTWVSFKAWYMEMYWQFDNLFLVSAKFLGITYHEFVLLSLVIVWPLLTLTMLLAIIKLYRDKRRLVSIIAAAVTVEKNLTVEVKAGTNNACMVSSPHFMYQSDVEFIARDLQTCLKKIDPQLVLAIIYCGSTRTLAEIMKIHSLKRYPVA